MKNKIVLRVLGGTLLLTCILLFAINIVIACTCQGLAVMMNDCIYNNAHPACLTEYGTPDNRCECIPDCICGDGVCVSNYYQQFGDDAFACDENDTTNPTTYCAVDCGGPICGNSHTETGEACDNGATSADRTKSCNSVDANTGRTYSGIQKCNTDCTGYGSCVVTTKCGDNLTNGIPLEQCDFGADNSNPPYITPPYSPIKTTYTYCNTTCNSTILFSKYCGDGAINGPEQCDGDKLNGKTCASLGLFTNTSSVNNGVKCNAATCTFDLSGCYGIAGWKPVTDVNWTTTTNNALNISVPGIIVSDSSFDLKVNVNYNLSYITTEQNSGCIVTMDFNGNTCTSFDTLTTKKCFDILDTDGVTPRVFKDDSGSQEVNRTVSYKFNLSSNNDVTNGIYFKDVKLRITVSESTPGACIGVLIQNISLKEKTNVENNIAYNDSQVNSLGATYTAGCCPINYCWDGKTCVDSALWMTNASYPPVWNSIWSANWTNAHVNTSNQQEAVGYRCVVINDTSGEAQWIPTQIKYDWNYQASGYCANSTDCFVNVTFNAGIQDGTKYGAYSMGCIRNGDVISDGETVGQGNHYCYRGNWTTRSYIVAKLLQNISKDSAYILQCYDNTSLVYNNMTTFEHDNILSACVIVIKDALNNNKEQVITGVILKNDDDASNFIGDITSEYIAAHHGESLNNIYTDCITNPLHTVSDSNFTKCAEQNANTGGLYVYYEKQYRYFIISDKLVVGIEHRPFWDSVVRFFQTFLFGSQVTHTSAFDAINYVTNYDRIYVMQNNTLNVSGIEESKYDEVKGHVVNILYVKYSGSNITNNPINRGDLLNVANQTMINLGMAETVPVEMNYTNDTTAKTQEIIIKTENRTGLWPYFTSILRNRQP